MTYSISTEWGEEIVFDDLAYSPADFLGNIWFLFLRWPLASTRNATNVVAWNSVL